MSHLWGDGYCVQPWKFALDSFLPFLRPIAAGSSTSFFNIRIERKDSIICTYIYICIYIYRYSCIYIYIHVIYIYNISWPGRKQNFWWVFPIQHPKAHFPKTPQATKLPPLTCLPQKTSGKKSENLCQPSNYPPF